MYHKNPILIPQVTDQACLEDLKQGPGPYLLCKHSGWLSMILMVNFISYTVMGITVGGSIRAK
jgi:hypothetical protein